MLLLLALTGCQQAAPFDLEGIWRFEVAVTLDEGNCETRVLHNFSDALEEEEGEGAGDTGEVSWDESATNEVSPQISFGRFVADGDGWLLLIDGDTLPQEAGGEAGSPSFAWERRAEQQQEQTHASGYRFREEQRQSQVTRVQISLPGAQAQKDAERSGTTVTLTGSWSEEATEQLGYEESDLWAEELGLGDVGQIPVGSYLTRLDELGYVAAAANSRIERDCTEDDCVLTVSSDCATTWELVATPTDIAPEDDGWVDEGWGAGI